MIAKTMWRGLFATAAFVCVMGAAGAAHAQPTQECDGFGPPVRGGDGMSQQGMAFFQAAGDRVRRTPSFQGGVQNCGLAIDQLDAQFPNFWLRRVSLLQSRALHQLLARDVTAALADLDAADASAAADADVYYQRSLAINTNMIRAYALIEKGDRAAGEALAMETWRRRPYSRETITGALVVIGPQGGQANIDELLCVNAQVDPTYSDGPFTYFFETGRFNEALAVYDQIKPPRTIEDVGYDTRAQLFAEENARARETFFWLHAGGRRAYALAALGRVADARAAISDGEQRLTDAQLPIPEVTTPPGRRRPAERDRLLPIVREQVNLDIETRGRQIQDAWSAVVEARIQAGEGHNDVARTTLQRIRAMPPSYAAIDLMQAMGAPADVLAQARTRLPADHANLPPRDLKLLFGILLDAETPNRTQSRVGALDRAFMSRERAQRGGCTEQRENEGLVNVCYQGFDATLAVTEERALIRAADLAIANNTPRFIVEGRRDIRHSIVSTYYGTPMSESQAGFESRLDIRYVDASEPCWRCVDANEIKTQFAPVYEAGQ